MSENFEVGEVVTLSSSAITKRDFASIGITEDTEFLIAKIVVAKDVYSSDVFFLTVLDGSNDADEYIVTENDVLGI